ncbi:DNA topoisomerase I [Micractinium conductrix]|uniref:DNA topoisomerase I n=1 Tax=Micractinium conductrix TaxID=554055 RepID=A0A2P6V0K3_9CHLO|nr:DNA topoisomerase I [Micractinium conductrix]|eukprot:PSC67628.1 DNA topoisomerase I [Micractinium conductrix]
MGTGKTGTGKTGAGKTGTGKTGTGKTGPGKTGTGKTRTGKTGTGKIPECMGIVADECCGHDKELVFDKTGKCITICKFTVEKTAVVGSYSWMHPPKVVKIPVDVSLVLKSYPPPVWTDGKKFVCQCPPRCPGWELPCKPCVMKPYVCPAKP